MAVTNDARSIAAVLFESFIEYKSSYTDAGFNVTTPTAEHLATRIDEGPGWVAVQDDTIVGTVAAVPKSDGLYIRGMAILPAARGQRVGELLLKHIEAYATEHEIKRLYLSTTPFLDRAIRLYENFGFKFCDEGPHDLFGTPLVTMEKFLDSSDQENG
jgi:putative acetyltransferase